MKILLCSAAGRMLCICIALCGATGAAGATYAMTPLDDTTLSSVQARDGFSFDLSNFSMAGDARYTYHAPGTTNASAYIANVYAARSDDPNREFSDPYRLDIARGGDGRADLVKLAFPENIDGAKRWQVAFDWGVDADGRAVQGGSVILKDAVMRGGGVELTTPAGTDGLAFGLGLRVDIGNILLRPRGRDDISQAEPAGVAEQMNFRGVKLGAVDGNGTFLDAPWRIADATSQPGILNAVTDDNGNARLHFGIGWPDAAGAPLGGLQVDNISFRSDASGTLDLGASRIGTIKIQYLDVKVRP